MKIRLLLALLCFFAPASAASQLAPSMYLEKATFARNEPVFLYLSLKNENTKPATALETDSEQPFCWGLQITLSNDQPAQFPCHASADSACVMAGALRMRQISPGQIYARRVLLNFHHDITDRGNYWVDAAYGGTSKRLYFKIDGSAPAFESWKPWLAQLDAPNWEQRSEAARVLASVAPRSQEEVLLGFPSHPEFRRYAPLALHRLNTPRSIATLVQFLIGPVTTEQIEAAGYLAATGDLTWFPKLRDVAIKNGEITFILVSAAELGRDKAIPLMTTLAISPDPTTRENAMMAMGSTASRAAVPFLIGRLRDPDPHIAERASYSLRLLTHRAPTGDEYVQWSRWWEDEGATAPIYKDQACGEMRELP